MKTNLVLEQTRIDHFGELVTVGHANHTPYLWRPNKSNCAQILIAQDQTSDAKFKHSSLISSSHPKLLSPPRRMPDSHLRIEHGTVPQPGVGDLWDSERLAGPGQVAALVDVLVLQGDGESRLGCRRGKVVSDGGRRAL